jgi:2-polyprenyl-3-methyl-5-hydroxy-6-metoxy-1,4-benzoquinol methylase
VPPPNTQTINTQPNTEGYVYGKGKTNPYLYDFVKYIGNGYWSSFYYQLIEIISIKSDSILEVGVGTGVLSAVLKGLGFPYKSLDLDPALGSDFIGSILDIPFDNNSYDIAVCFEVIEHLPYENFQKALSELFRIANKAVIISLPNAKTMMRYSFHIPKLGYKKLLIPRPWFRPREYIYAGTHYWEINTKGYPISRIREDINSIATKYNFVKYKEYRVWENPYHHFFCFKKNTQKDMLSDNNEYSENFLW